MLCKILNENKQKLFAIFYLDNYMDLQCSFPPYVSAFFLEELPPPSLANVLFQGYRFLIFDFCYRLLKPISTFFYYIHEYRGFKKKRFDGRNSTLRRQFLNVFFQCYFVITKNNF